MPTRNRREELRALLISAQKQTLPLEMLVMDDGCSDGTAEMLRTEFPTVKLHQLASERGPAFQRNRGIELATANIVFPLDDDTVFVSPQTAAQTLAEFSAPRIAAVGIPFINIRQDCVVQQRAPSVGAFAVHAFVGAAHAVRRDVFLKLGGYREHFFYMGEEGDLCLRMMEAGYVTMLGRADPIHHLESPSRNLSRAGFSGRRNDILFCWHNVPMPYLPLQLLGTTLNGLRSAVGSSCLWPMLKGLVSGYASCFQRWNERAPASAVIYRLHRSLKKRGPQLLSQVEKQLPPLI